MGHSWNGRTKRLSSDITTPTTQASHMIFFPLFWVLLISGSHLHGVLMRLHVGQMDGACPFTFIRLM